MTSCKGGLDPMQQAFLSNYLDPKSDTFSNIRQSAMKAGYSQEYSDNLTGIMPKWLSENIGRSKMLAKAERNLDKALDIPIEDKELGERALKATLFVAKGIGKEVYSERNELTGKDGKDLPTPIIGYVPDNNSHAEDNGPKEKN